MPRAIKVKTSLGDQVFRFVHFSGHEKLSRGFEYHLSVESDDGTLDMPALLGQPVTVEVELPKSGLRHFNGYVASIGMDGGSTRFARYRIVLRPWTYLMSLGSNCRVFQNKTVLEIVKLLFEEWSFKDVRVALSDSYRTLEYCVQYRESDFNFISRLLEREGIYYYFEHADGKHTLVLADSASAHLPTPDYEEVVFFPPGESQHFDDTLSSWGTTCQIRPGAYSSTDFDPTRPRAGLLARLIRPKKHPHDNAEIYDYPGEYPRSPETADDSVKAGEGPKHVQVRLDEHQADFELAHAHGTVQGLTTGGLFKLTRHTREDQNKQYIVVSASYDIGGNSHESGADANPSFEGSYSCLSNEHQYRAPSETPRPRMEGPQTATVVGPKGQEILTDPLGRVKVQFHWDQLGKKDESSSCWVRVSQIWAGAGWGAMHIPRIGHEVVVDFLDGDPDRPLITGRVYNGVNLPPYTLTDNKTQSGIKSRSTPNGTPSNFNEIRFEDLKGKEELFVQAERNQTVHVKASRSLSVGGSETISVGGTRTTTVTKKDTVKLLDEHHVTVTQLVTQYFKNGHILDVYAADQEIYVQMGRNDYVGKVLSMESGEQIVLKVGEDTSITIAEGKIDIKAKMVSINGETVVDVKGGLIKLNS